MRTIEVTARTERADGRVEEIGCDAGMWHWRLDGAAWSRAYRSEAHARMGLARFGRPRAPRGGGPKQECAYCSALTRHRAADPDDPEGGPIPVCPPGFGCGVGLPTAPAGAGGTPR